MSDAMRFVLPVVYLALCGLVGYAAFKWPEIRLRRTLRYVGYRNEGRGTVVLEFETKSGNRREYRGQCTVWHTVPSGYRCGIQTESFLCEIWAANVTPTT